MCHGVVGLAPVPFDSGIHTPNAHAVRRQSNGLGNHFQYMFLVFSLSSKARWQSYVVRPQVRAHFHNLVAVGQGPFVMSLHAACLPMAEQASEACCRSGQQMMPMAH